MQMFRRKTVTNEKTGWKNKWRKQIPNPVVPDVIDNVELIGLEQYSKDICKIYKELNLIGDILTELQNKIDKC